MKIMALIRVIALAGVTSSGVLAVAAAQTTDPHHPDTTAAQKMPPTASGDTAAQPVQTGMGGMPMRMGGHAHMMKIMLAILDTNGDGGLSFEELTTVEKRIFDLVDADKDGKVTPSEIQAFMQE
jgi:hypothetical protein